MTEIILTRGLPASGKSTYAKDMVTRSNGQVVRVNLDDIRAMLGFGHNASLAWNNELEKTALAVQDNAILAAVKAGKDVIVDNTNLQKRGPERIKKLFDGEVTFRVADFTGVSVAECIERDSKRANPVGADVIRKMSGQLKKSFDLAAFMNDYAYPIVPYDPSTPDSDGDERQLAVIFDIDGTLARHHRSPFDYSRLGTDSVFEHIKNLNHLYYEDGYHVFIVSGRPDTYRAETEQWLQVNGIKYDELYMRRGDDTRNDADVKHEIFDREFRSDFEIDLWVDDRNRVVRRMRKLGINVAQVADGDF